MSSFPNHKYTLYFFVRTSVRVKVRVSLRSVFGIWKKDLKYEVSKVAYGASLLCMQSGLDIIFQWRRRKRIVTVTWNKELFCSSHIHQIHVWLKVSSAPRWLNCFTWKTVRLQMVDFIPVVLPSIVLIGFPCDQSASLSSLLFLTHILFLHYLSYICPPVLASASVSDGSCGFLAVNLVSSRCSSQLMLCFFVIWYVFFSPHFDH